ncbi:MAG: CHAT domain-containing protein [Alphaproteobacteria bacterium]|nr:CHAT domain-containing protein [Alphaproteobacteria bacterium]
MAISFSPGSGLSTLSPESEIKKIPEAAAILRERLTREPLRARYRELGARHAKLRETLGQLRAKGYLWMPGLEQRLLSAVTKAEAAAKALPEGAVTLPRAAVDQLAGVEQQAIALAGLSVDPKLAGALVGQFNGACEIFHAPLEDAETALNALSYALDLAKGELAAVEEMLARFAGASFRLAAGEHPIAALTAKWVDAPDGQPHKGMLYLSTQAVRFERDEEIVEGGVFGFFAKSKRRVREVELTGAVAQLQDAEGEQSGWVMKDKVLIFQWAPGSPGAPSTRFALTDLDELPDELDAPEEWAAFLDKLVAHDVQRFQVEPKAWEGVPALPYLPGEAPPAPELPTPKVAEVWPAEAWMQVEIDLDGESFEVALTASSSGQQTPPQRIEGLSLPDVEAYAEAVRQTAHRGVDLPADALFQAHELFRLLFGGEPVGVLHALRGLASASGGKVLVRLMVGDSQLKGLPWEVMRGPGREDGFLAMHPDLTLVRGVYGAQPVDAGPIQARPRVLVLAPGELAASGQELHDLLADQHGEDIELLPALLGEDASWAELSTRLMGEAPPHVLHAVVHGRIDGGLPELQLAGGWVPAELLAVALKPAARKGLRLVYLESCETAHSGELASAAELMARRGAEAVVAQLWPVSPKGARAVSGRFYKALLGHGPEHGDVAASLNVARLVAAADLRSAEFLCPVLYLRGEDPRLFAKE